MKRGKRPKSEPITALIRKRAKPEADWFAGFLRRNPDVSQTLRKYSNAARVRGLEHETRSAQGTRGNDLRWKESRERAERLQALSAAHPRRAKETQNHYWLRIGHLHKPAVSADIVRRALKK